MTPRGARWKRIGKGIVAGIATVTVSIGAFLSCRQVVGIQDSAGTTACGLPWGTSDCASCIASSCCSEATTCSGDPACTAFFDCIGSCKQGEWQCRSQCQLDHSFGAAIGFPALSACAAGKCQRECGLTCGGIEYGFPSPANAPACQQCLDTNDCTSERACASSVDCMTFGQCVRAATTLDEQYACAESHDAGYSLVRAIDPNKQCPACVQPNWTCVGRVAWPGPTLQSTTLKARFTYFSLNTPAAGLDVTLCRFADSKCASHFGSATTDPAGNVALQVPAQTALSVVAADSYVLVTSPPTASQQSIPAMFFLGYPVTEPLAPVGAEVLFVFPASDAGAPVGLSSWNSETRGWIGFGVFDCNLQGSVPGVKVTLDPPDPSVSEYYLQGSSAPDFDAMATSAGLSAGGFINVAPGMVTLTATPLGTNVPSSVVHVLVRPGYLSQVFLFPTP